MKEEEKKDYKPSGSGSGATISPNPTKSRPGSSSPGLRTSRSKSRGDETIKHPKEEPKPEVKYVLWDISVYVFWDIC